jgi:hypothetical protein
MSSNALMLTSSACPNTADGDLDLVLDLALSPPTWHRSGLKELGDALGAVLICFTTGMLHLVLPMKPPRLLQVLPGAVAMQGCWNNLSAPAK